MQTAIENKCEHEYPQTHVYILSVAAILLPLST